jgi:membrane peptidoglycan carboxypeptidase
MLKRMKKFYRRRKLLAVCLLLFIVPLSLVLLYAASVMVRAYVDTPKVVARATSPDVTGLRLEDVPDDYRRILLAVEDPNFYTHHGVDFTTPGAGWTTITQGIVKVYFYNGFTPGVFRYRKLEQSLIAWVFDSRVDKATQLQIFINAAYFGEHDGRDVIGFSDAARSYFNKEFAALTRDEYISLVAMLVAPNGFNVAGQPSQNSDRVHRINRLLSGQCAPTGHADVYYEACG